MFIWEYIHHVIGVHFWDIPAILTLGAIAVTALVHTRNQRKREKAHRERPAQSEA